MYGQKYLSLQYIGPLLRADHLYDDYRPIYFGDSSVLDTTSTLRYPPQFPVGAPHLAHFSRTTPVTWYLGDTASLSPMAAPSGASITARLSPSINMAVTRGARGGLWAGWQADTLLPLGSLSAPVRGISLSRTARRP